MLRISRETDYAIRVLLALARRQPGEQVLTRDIQQEMGIPKQMVTRVVARLAKGGFIKSTPGRGGGIKLAHDPETISLRQVVTFFERSFVISECLTDPQLCPFEDHCPVRCRWARLQAMILYELEKTTFADLTAEAQDASAEAFTHATRLGPPF